jgi:hypothetical protein
MAAFKEMQERQHDDISVRIWALYSDVVAELVCCSCDVLEESGLLTKQVSCVTFVGMPHSNSDGETLTGGAGNEAST